MQQPAVRVRSLGVNLKAVTLPLEQLPKESFGFGTIVWIHKVRKANRAREPCPAYEHLLQRRI